MNDSPQPSVRIIMASGRLNDAIVAENYMDLQFQAALAARAAAAAATTTTNDAEKKKKEEETTKKHRNKENKLN
eukprot:CAMPEP_0201716904 /NCGR_PEP_ID=MMETSP0593-20130828/2776_1 /ASSEMBLY_ACC=CAM_ASM_000672 /TAXON_ID=267983 /ORGANISM="Skeletonema japonicum, Strain CCMP2506" /LENGTH=73 /DNA_ID=CAMNT_0048206825 /DNA_START=300 /DNA_END=520 /DNA_ORIENTATION=+